MEHKNAIRHRSVAHAWAALLFIALAWTLTGCAQLQLPAIDPSGNRLFIPGRSTQILTPGATAAGTQGGGLLGGVLGSNPLGWANSPQSILPPLGSGNQLPVQPAFQAPPAVAPCNTPTSTGRQSNCLVPKACLPNARGRRGEIIMTPSRIVAPVGAEVVVLAGICGGDGYFVNRQPLEWMLSNDSVGQFIEVGGTENHKVNKLKRASAQKFDGQYAWGRTGAQKRTIDRGTPTPTDDIYMLEGQTFVSVSSASPGTSYVTGVAPKAEAWDKRRASTIIHWVDANWAIPTPAQATAGTVYPLTTVVTRSTNGEGVKDYQVKYTIVGGAPAEFAPTGSQEAIVDTGTDGRATVQLRQQAGQFDPGTTQIRVDVIQPPLFGQSELVVESGITSVNWSSPALTIRAIGPKSAGLNEPFNYRIEVSNPGDQVARDVVVRTDNIGENVEYISSTPKPNEYGRTYEWSLGDIPPGGQPKVINLQMKSDRRGTSDLCFDVESRTDQLQTEACAQTEIEAPCIGLEIEGPTDGVVGDKVIYILKIVNQCEESLRNVEFQVQTDPTLTTAFGGLPMRQTIDTLPFGQSRELPLEFVLTETGQKCFDLTVTADDGHSARSRRCINVGTSPTSGLEFDLQGDRVTDVGGRARTMATIRNNGNQAIDRIVVTNAFSPSIDPVTVSNGYNQGLLGKDLVFSVGRLDPGQEAKIVVEYEGIQEDGDAFSEMTLTTLQGASITKRLPIRVEPGGTVSGPSNPNLGGASPGSGPPGGSGSQGGSVVDPFPSEPEGNIGIPQDPPVGGQPQGLQLRARAINRDIFVNDGQDRGPNAPYESTIEYTVTNTGPLDQNVDLQLLKPRSLELVNIVPLQSGIRLNSRLDEENSIIYFEQILDLRQESLTFRATYRGRIPGEATVELRANSANTIGTITATEVINVRE